MIWLVYLLVFLIVFKVYYKISCGMCTDDTTMLTGKVALITGANTGIGYETARDLAKRGAKVIMACRDETKAIPARDTIIRETGNSNVIYKQLNLSSFKSVREFAQDILKSETKLDILINNAGMGNLDNMLTEDNIPIEMQVNHFSPFLLTTLLLPLLSSPGCRVINVSSLMHWLGSVDFNQFHKKADCIIRCRRTYSNSKLANILFTNELARRLKETKGTANSLHPGAVNSEIFRNKSYFVRFLISLAFKSPWEGAQTSIYLAVSNDVEGVSGQYYSDCKEARTRNCTKDQALANKFWEYSDSIVNNAPNF